jgi:hypothetical protein
MNTPARHLRRLARSYGVQLDYTDPSGRLQVATSESLLAVLRALGCDIRLGGTPDRPCGAQLWRRAGRAGTSRGTGAVGIALRLPASVAAPRMDCTW